MSNQAQVWTITGILFAAAALRTTITFLDYPDRSNLALLQWSAVPLWLLAILVGVWRQWRSMRAGDERLARDSALRLAVAGYAPIVLLMGLIDRLH
jgi:hypothetical protein